jgi:hypothetical protein
MKRFLAQIPSGGSDNRKAYIDWCTGRDDAPTPTALDKNHGGFAAVRELAR